MIKHFSLRFSLFLFLLDTVLITAGLWLATFARIILPFGLPGDPEIRVLPLSVYGIAFAVHHLIYAMMNVHSPRHNTTLLRELQVITAAAFIGWLMFLGALYMTVRDVSRLQTAYFFAAHLLLIYASRVCIRLWFAARGQRRLNMRNVLVIGTSQPAQQMIDLIQDHRYTGLHVVGVIAVEANPTLTHTPILGNLENLEAVIKQCDVGEAVIALERDTNIDLPALVRRLQALPVNIRLIPQYTDLAFLQIYIEDFSGMPLLTLKEPVLTPYQRLLKRFFDILLTLAIFIPALPMMAFIALWIRLDSPGPILFRQQRIGEGGRAFEMLKFRSMVVGAEWQQEVVKQYDPNGNAIYKHPNDPRITGVGRWLRITSLDELPQLWNILRGDMSLVGPRPELPDLVNNYQPWQRKRFEVPQGLTGWWQVNGRANKPMHLSTEDDLFYIRNYSIWLDLRILWRTIWVVMSRRGAF